MRCSRLLTCALVACCFLPARISAFSPHLTFRSGTRAALTTNNLDHFCLSRVPVSFVRNTRPVTTLRIGADLNEPNEFVTQDSGITGDEEEIRQKITMVVDQMMSKHPAAMAPAPLGELPPRIFLDNVEALLNEPVYKNVMYRRLEECSSEEELQLLEVVDEKLLEFKKEQRDLINKAKLEYIIGAALEGPEVLDEIMTEFCENRGLDDGLVDYLDEIVAKAQEDENNSDSKESVLVKMLKVIKDRVVAEIRTRDKPYVKLLASLLRMEDHPEREAFLRGALLNPDDATRFQGFIVDGVQYMEQHRADWLMDERVEKMKMIAREVGMFKKLLEQRRDAAARQKAEKPSS